jgi:hypothetical protein
LFFARGYALGASAVFNQLVRSRAQLLFLGLEVAHLQQTLKKEHLRATAHQLIKHDAKGLG